MYLSLRTSYNSNDDIVWLKKEAFRPEATIAFDRELRPASDSVYGMHVMVVVGGYFFLGGGGGHLGQSYIIVYSLTAASPRKAVHLLNPRPFIIVHSLT